MRVWLAGDKYCNSGVCSGVMLNEFVVQQMTSSPLDGRCQGLALYLLIAQVRGCVSYDGGCNEAEAVQCVPYIDCKGCVHMYRSIGAIG